MMDRTLVSIINFYGSFIMVDGQRSLIIILLVH